MPEVIYFIYSEGIQIDNQPHGQRTIIQGPLLGLTPTHIPGQFSFAITVGILGIDVEVEHTLRYVFINPEDITIIDSGQLTIPKAGGNPRNLPPDMRGATLTLDVRNAELATEGQYKSEVYLDGAILGPFPVKVKQTINPGDE